MNAIDHLHLIKLAVGPDTLTALKTELEKRYREQRRKKQKPEFVHVTRHTPKRAEELLNHGSLYWVIKGYICARQRIVELRPLLVDDVPHCGIVLAPEIIQTVRQPRRPFQGWRYLNSADAPPDLGDNDSDVPESMLRELKELGLL